MAIEIGTINADTSVKLGTTTINMGLIGLNEFYNNNSYTSILDTYPTSIHHAYSLRKLKSNYTGFCLRVRRTAATSTEVNVSFDVLNTISLQSKVTYVSGTATNAKTLGQFAAIAGYGTADAGVTANQNIFVVTWYDQSGNGKNPTNSNAGQQPRLVNSATADLERSGGKVAVRGIKSNSTRLTILDTTANINNISSYFVGAFFSNTTPSIGYGLSTGISRWYFPNGNGTNVFYSYGTTTTTMLSEAIDTTRRLYHLSAPSPLNSAVAQGWTNGIPKATVLLASGAITSIQLFTQAAAYFDGYIQEVISWQSNTNRAEKETNINNYWQIYTPL